jgi:branched-chain amino acid transport system ATP-binding protein
MLARVFALFPLLGERQAQVAGTLSGGEQQMCAIGRGLMARPELLLLDEPSLGLAPVMVRLIFDTLREINENGTTILLVEQNVARALQLSHRGYVIENGGIALHGTREALQQNPHVKEAYLGL